MMPSIADKTHGSFGLEEGLGYLARTLTDYTDDTGHRPLFPEEFAAAAKASEPENADRPDLLDLLQLAAAYGHAFALARLEEPFGTEEDWLEAARVEGMAAMLRYYGVGEEVA